HDERSTSPLYTLSLHDALPISLERDHHLWRGERPLRGHHRGLADIEGPVLDAFGLDVVEDTVRVLDGELLTHENAEYVRMVATPDRKSTRLNSSHVSISYAVFC